jgi:hypothetical protein
MTTSDPTTEAIDESRGEGSDESEDEKAEAIQQRNLREGKF